MEKEGGATWGGGYTDTPARGDNYVPVGYVQNQGAEDGVTGMLNCPQLYEMPETIQLGSSTLFLQWQRLLYQEWQWS